VCATNVDVTVSVSQHKLCCFFIEVFEANDSGNWQTIIFSIL